MNNPYPSTLLENAVNEFAKLPGIGRKSALRLVLHLLRQDEKNVNHFTETLLKLKKEVNYCTCCHNISDTEICAICADKSRDPSVICVVENVRDVMSIENTGSYKGLYHVLGGIISPIDGISPADLAIEPLLERLQKGNVQEVILALSTTMEGETTCFYLYKKMAQFPLKITTIARGVGFGDQLEYTDELTLGRSIENRQPFKPE